MNSKIKIYVDQNIVSPFYNDPVDFKVPEIIEIVFSSALLDDFKAADKPEKHLASLEAMGAIMVSANPLDIDFTFNRNVDLEVELSRVTVKDRLFSFDTSRAHSSSGQHKEASRDEIERAMKQFQDSRNDNASVLNQFVNPLYEVMLKGLLEMIESTPPIEKGSPLPGLLSKNYDRRTAIKDIWNDLPSSEKELYPTPDIYFGFESSGRSVPILAGIDTCCVIFDRLAYYAEPKRKRPLKQNNVQNDSKHIGYATQCDILLSSDKNLIYRAETIYSHLEIDCRPVLVEPGTRLTEKFLQELIY
ncbi:hypothetical protein [Gilvimarinus chinensis]|uniref:hypothetical protein n=1 Tax=Gilvimarinus chinensis TaxID=396005 RepID=UPI00036AC4D3|nr:hypothetical protein [Gilvimarinus chinensis]